MDTLFLPASTEAWLSWFQKYKANQVRTARCSRTWVQGLRMPQDFKPAAILLYYHSATFPKVMGIMLSLIPRSENWMMPFYAKHALGEADYHAMLLDWMLRHPKGAEGYVHADLGRHGIGNLVPAIHDWRNPAAKITIRRLAPGDDNSPED
jgi:hypothetical protein